MPDKITINAKDILEMVNILKSTVENGGSPENKNEKALSPMAAYLLAKADYPIQDVDGKMLAKSEIDEVTLDFTRGRTLTEEESEIAINYIYNTNPYLSMFNTRIVKKLVTPVEGKAITRKNLISNEQKGGEVSVINRRIVHNFGVNLYLRHTQLQKDIPLQTVIDNLHNPGWETQVINDVATALGNDILLLALNGLGGNYASTEDFYDLNKGFNKILQEADGIHTNTYGEITVVGFLGIYLTPQKVDASGAIGTDYTGTNLLALMRKIYKAMPKKYRDNPNNVFMMSQADIDLYLDTRSDMTNPSNTTREAILNTGIVPSFMGFRLVAMPGWLSINETHESDDTLYGSIVFGDLKSLDVASDKVNYMRTSSFNARADLGPAFEYNYDMYLDFQPAIPESFVIAFNGAKVSDPVLLSADNSKNGMVGFTPSGTNTYAESGSADTPWHVCVDNRGAVIVKSPNSLTAATTLADALEVADAVVQLMIFISAPTILIWTLRI